MNESVAHAIRWLEGLAIIVALGIGIVIVLVGVILDRLDQISRALEDESNELHPSGFGAGDTDATSRP